MSRRRPVTFAGITIEVVECDPEAGRLVDFLFGRFPERDHSTPCVTLDLAQDGPATFALWRDGSLVYSRTAAAAAARLMLAEALHKFAANCLAHTMVHAAAVAHEGRGFLLPGVSGAGKSTMTAWLDFNGFVTLGDEIIGIGGNGDHLLPFPRPICLEPAARAVVPDVIQAARHEGRLLETDDVVILAPRSTLPPDPVPLAAVIFLHYAEGSDLQFRPMSKGAAATRLMESVVNPSALPNHSFAQIGSLVRHFPRFSLRFGTFEQCLDAIRKAAFIQPAPIAEMAHS